MGVERLIEEISIDQMSKQGVQGLADRPNSMTAQYGKSGLTAQELKAWFDKLALEIFKKINAMTGKLVDPEGAKYIPTNIEGYISLKALATAFSDGAFAENVLKLYSSSADKVSGQNIKSLQAIINNIAQTLSAHQEYIDNDAGWYAGEDFNSLGEGKIPQKGDLYLITGGSYTLGDVYQYDGSGWQRITNIRGEKGEKGDTSQNFIEHNTGTEVKMFVGTIDEWKAYSDKTNTLFIPTDGETLESAKKDLQDAVDERVATVESKAQSALNTAGNAERIAKNALAKTHDLYRHVYKINTILFKNIITTNTSNAVGGSDPRSTLSFYVSNYNGESDYISNGVYYSNPIYAVFNDAKDGNYYGDQIAFPISVPASVTPSNVNKTFYGTLLLDYKNNLSLAGGNNNKLFIVGTLTSTDGEIHNVYGSISLDDLSVGKEEIHKCS